MYADDDYGPMGYLDGPGGGWSEPPDEQQEREERETVEIPVETNAEVVDGRLR